MRFFDELSIGFFENRSKILASLPFPYHPEVVKLKELLF
jgi:hypothetical protein